MRVLITGINGFTGVYLEKLFRSYDFQVFGTTIDEPLKDTHLKCDITNIDDVKAVLNEIRPDYIIHLAAISFVASDPMKTYKVNVFGTLNILDSLVQLKLAPKKIILASSAAVYGNQQGSLSESNFPTPVNHYGNSKLVMENMAKNYFDKLKILMVRPFNYTGIGQESHFLIPKIISHYVLGKKTIELGNINVFREYNDINDIVRAYYMLLIGDAHSQIFNLCSGKSYSISQILIFLNKKVNYEIKVSVNQNFVRKNEILDLKGDPSKLYQFLGDKQFETNIDETLSRMLSLK